MGKQGSSDLAFYLGESSSGLEHLEDFNCCTKKQQSINNSKASFESIQVPEEERVPEGPLSSSTRREAADQDGEVPWWDFFGQFALQSNPWIPYIGECKALDEFLATKTGPGWLFPKFFNAFFRGVGQVVFANNPLTGLVILLSIFWADPLVGLATTVASTTAILTAVLFCQEPSFINSGLSSYNAVIVGSVTASLWTPLYGESMGVKIWLFVILGSALSVLITKGLANMMSSFNQPLPCLTLPFNVVTLLLFTCLMPLPNGGVNGPAAQNLTDMNMNGIAMELTQKLPEPLSNNTMADRANSRALREAEGPAQTVTFPPPDDSSSDPSSGDNGTKVNRVYVNDEMHWGNILFGILMSMGQVYGVNNLIASILMYFATMVYSPTVFMMSFAGATLGTIAGITFSEVPYDTVYDGLWGFNGILSAISVGGLFFVLSCHSFGLAMANVILTVLIQQALAIAFGPLRLPVFTLPFVLSTLLILSVSSTGDYLTRVKNITFPEMHRYEFLENQRINRPESSRPPRDTTDEIAEEKELVLKEVKVIMEDSPDKEKAIAGEGNGSRGESGETQQVNGGTENAKETAD